MTSPQSDDAPGSGPGPSSSSVSSINSQLLFHGWTKRPLNLDVLSEKDQTEIITVLFELLGSNVSNVATMDELSSRHRTLLYEHERLGKTATQLRSSRDRLVADVSRWQARCADLEKRLVLEEEKCKGMKEELSRGRKALESVRVAAIQNAKKAQVKLDKAVAQLTKSDNLRTHGLVLLNPIIGNKSAPVATGQAPLLEQALKDMAEIRQGLQEETEAFRHVIVSTANSLRESVALASGQEVPERMLQAHFFSNDSSSSSHSSRNHGHVGTFQSASSTSHPSIADSRLRTLTSEIHIHLTSGLPPPIRASDKAGSSHGETEEEAEEKRRFEREREKVLIDLQDKVKDLEVEVQCALAREIEAKKVVEEMTKAQIQASAAAARAGEDDDLINLRAELARQKRLLDDEKRKFTEATIRLAHDRQNLESERQAFLEERRRADRDAILAFLPNSPTTSPNSTELNIPSNPTLMISPHRPHAPSPLSPMHPRHTQVRPHSSSPSSPRQLAASHQHLVGVGKGRTTPKVHSVKRKGTKTPLSRMVLEKAVREKSRASTVANQLLAASVSASAGGGGGGGGRALVEGGRKGNVGGEEKESMTMGKSIKGKEKATITTTSSSSSSSSSSSTTPPFASTSRLVKSTLASSIKGRTTTPPATTVTKSGAEVFAPVSTFSASTNSTLTGSVRGGKNMGVSIAATLARSTGPGMGSGVGVGKKVDSSTVGGIGPRSAAKGVKVWR